MREKPLRQRCQASAGPWLARGLLMQALAPSAKQQMPEG
jgi:hypothetical protein